MIHINKNLRTGITLLSFVACIVAVGLILSPINPVIEKVNVEKNSKEGGDDDPEYNFYVNQPVFFYTYNGNLSGDMNYTHYPSGIYNHSNSYSYYSVYDLAIANVEIFNSNIDNCYFHNSTIMNCNIEDATFINCTLMGCYIGSNVTFINCPPGSDPSSGMELSEYFGEGLESKYDNYISNYNTLINDAANLENQMKSYTPDNEIPPEYYLQFYVKDYANVTLTSLYNIESNNTNIIANMNYIDDYTIVYFGLFENAPIRVDFNITFKMQMDEGWNHTYIRYDGYMNYDDLDNSYFNTIFQSIKTVYHQGMNEATYTTRDRLISGNNGSFESYSLFEYNSTPSIVHEVQDLEGIETECFQLIETNECQHIWEKSTINGTDAYCNKIINETTMNITLCEFTFFNHYIWSEYYERGYVKSDILMKDGKVLDPKVEIYKDKYRKKIFRWKKTIGGEVSIYIKLYESEVNALDIGGGLDVGALLILIGLAIGTAGAAVVVAIIGLFLAAWWKYVKTYIDKDTGDLELLWVTKGYFATGGVNMLYAYKYDKGDPKYIIRWPKYVDGMSIRLLVNRLRAS